MTGVGTTTLAYDYEGRVTTITYPSTATNTFTYNGLDTRVSKVDSTGTRTYLRDGAYVTDPVLSDGAANYTAGISEKRSGTTKFYHNDRLGSTERLTNTSQSTTDTRQYDAFGLLVSSSGSTATPFGFAGAWGYQEDPDSGLKLLGHRYYDPSTGRFLTRDPVKDGRNWYAYCEGNPTGLVDPDGHLAVIPVLIVLAIVSLSVTDANAPTKPGDIAPPNPGANFGAVFGLYGYIRNPGDLAWDLAAGAIEGNKPGGINKPGTEPKKPPSKIVEQDGVSIVQHVNEKEHGPGHAHVSGQGPNTKIGQNGKPLKGQPPLSPQQQAVVDRNETQIRKAIGQGMKYWGWLQKIFKR